MFYFPRYKVTEMIEIVEKNYLFPVDHSGKIARSLKSGLILLSSKLTNSPDPASLKSEDIRLN